MPGREAIVTTFTHKFESPGTHIGHVNLTSDRLQIDNRHYFAFGAYGQIRVLCVGEQTVVHDVSVESRNSGNTLNGIHDSSSKLLRSGVCGFRG